METPVPTFQRETVSISKLTAGSDGSDGCVFRTDRKSAGGEISDILTARSYANQDHAYKHISVSR